MSSVGGADRIVDTGFGEKISNARSITKVDASAGDGESSIMVGNQTIMVGLDHADELRSLLMKNVRASQSAGLGDDLDRCAAEGWVPADLELLAAILGEVKMLRNASFKESDENDTSKCRQVAFLHDRTCKRLRGVRDNLNGSRRRYCRHTIPQPWTCHLATDRR